MGNVGLRGNVGLLVSTPFRSPLLEILLLQSGITFDICTLLKDVVVLHMQPELFKCSVEV